MFRTVVRWLAVGLGVVILALAGLSLVARFSDGPLGPFSGGAFEAGETLESRGVDWKFVENVANVELQLLEPARSRTTWIIHHEGQIYIPCGAPEFRLWKRWPHQALVDGRALLRVDGEIYPLSLVKIEDAALHSEINRLLSEKYDAPTLEMESLWIFRLDPRS